MMFSSRQNGKEKRNGGKKNCEMAGRKVKWREDTIHKSYATGRSCQISYWAGRLLADVMVKVYFFLCFSDGWCCC
jgi:hypothetical protein